MGQDEHVEQPTEEYDAPAVEDLDSTEGAAVTAAGGTNLG
jgi:hypothetical protein